MDSVSPEAISVATVQFAFIFAIWVAFKIILIGQGSTKEQVLFGLLTATPIGLGAGYAWVRITHHLWPVAPSETSGAIEWVLSETIPFLSLGLTVVILLAALRRLLDLLLNFLMKRPQK
ncbi:MAG: hypothetical protein KC877_01330 [Candidatus Kaiserbacteria bacterium]|nr:hypothetical protein [Candidatus Kaiserbacteria bacterium]MCB9815784.1 hypothetical protein [Candidatus Nomurabacteria bacterium]